MEQMQRLHIHGATCRRMCCNGVIVVTGHDDTPSTGSPCVCLCEWYHLCCGDEVGDDYTSPSSHRPLGTLGHSSYLSVLPCPLTHVFTLGVCVSSVGVLCQRPSHTPTRSASSSSSSEVCQWRASSCGKCCT